MARAHESVRRSAGVVAEPMSAVPAYVEERAKRSGVIAYDNEALACDLVGDVGASDCELRLMSHERPLTKEDPLRFHLENVLGCIAGARQGRSGRRLRLSVVALERLVRYRRAGVVTAQL